jgi:hypothetical protein
MFSDTYEELNAAKQKALTKLKVLQATRGIIKGEIGKCFEDIKNLNVELQVFKETKFKVGDILLLKGEDKDSNCYTMIVNTNPVERVWLDSPNAYPFNQQTWGYNLDSLEFICNQDDVIPYQVGDICVAPNPKRDEYMQITSVVPLTFMFDTPNDNRINNEPLRFDKEGKVSAYLDNTPINERTCISMYGEEWWKFNGWHWIRVCGDDEVIPLTVGVGNTLDDLSPAIEWNLYYCIHCNRKYQFLSIPINGCRCCRIGDINCFRKVD